MRLADGQTEMAGITIWLPGQPARVTNQSGVRHLHNGRSYKTPALKAWEKELAVKLRPYAPDQPIDGPVELRVCFGYEAKAKRDLWKWKITRPDTDNSIKTVKDVMTKLGFWHDDAQVSKETCKKMWVDVPGIAIYVRRPGEKSKEEWPDLARGEDDLRTA